MASKIFDRMFNRPVPVEPPARPNFIRRAMSSVGLPTEPVAEEEEADTPVKRRFRAASALLGRGSAGSDLLGM